MSHRDTCPDPHDARNLRLGRDRCVACGLRVTLHYTRANRKVTCAEANAAHQHATIRCENVSRLLREVRDAR